MDERKDPMSEFSVNPVGKSGGEVPSVPPVNPEPHKTVAEAPKSPIPTHSFPGNTRLIFKVDQDDHKVVVMIVDQTSSEVIRTVPGDAMKDIPSGGLIEKNA